ncbi:MAG: hypothetical protein LBR85_05145 [Oscillospiraceae bacterium]|nr:hypothetical protein [Oscillospiraceae bacterium]
MLIRRGETAFLENLLFKLVIQAEKDFGGGTGALKRATVIDWVYERLPRILTLFISRSLIERLLDSALAAAKKKWAENPLLRDYISGNPPTPSVSSIDSTGQ